MGGLLNGGFLATVWDGQTAAKCQNSRPPFGTGLSGPIITTSPSLSGKPSISMSLRPRGQPLPPQRIALLPGDSSDWSRNGQSSLSAGLFA